MLKKILLTVLAIIILAVLCVYIYVQSSWDKTYDWPGLALKTTTDSSTIARGKYLVNGSAHCISCHLSIYPDLMIL